MKSRTIRCIKFFLTVFNIICIVFGVILITITVINIREKKSRPEQQHALTRGVLSFLLTVGLALVITAVSGCIAALRENVKILYVHAGFFLFLVSVELVVGIGGAVLTAWMGSSSDLRVHFYKNTTTDYDLYDDIKNHQMWDNLQSENKCCGIDGPQDYSNANLDIPASCCVHAYSLREGGARRHLHATCLTERTYYMRGCEEVMRQKKASKGNILIAVGIIFAILQILCIILAVWMARAVRRERRKLQANLQAHFET